MVKIETQSFADFYTLGNELGRGRFAKVKEAIRISDGIIFAVKIQSKRRRGRDARSALLKEIDLHEMCSTHPRFPKLHQVFETTGQIMIVLDYASGGEIFPYCVGDFGFERFTETDVIRYMHQVLEGIRFLHCNCIAHLDIKPQNILLSAKYPIGDIMIVDFGLAKSLDSAGDVRELIGTPDYVAPEILNYEPISLAADVWSLGVLSYVMITGLSPFCGDTKESTFLNVTKVNYEFPQSVFEQVSQQAIDFIQKTLVLKPSKRLSIEECLEHDWFNPKTPLSPCSLSWTSLDGDSPQSSLSSSNDSLLSTDDGKENNGLFAN